MSEPDDQAWILQRERGEDVSHIPARTRASYHRLAALIEALPDSRPDPGWKRRIFASLDAPAVRDIGSASRRGPGRPLRLVAGLASAAAIATALALWNRAVEERPSDIAAVEGPQTPESSRPSVATAEDIQVPLANVMIRRSDTPHRSSDGASIGDTLILSIEVGRPSELRVYGDAGEPLARCPETPGCTVEPSENGRRFQLELVLRASGTVRAVLFTGDSIPESFQSLNVDAETAQRANVDARQVAFVHVQ